MVLSKTMKHVALSALTLMVLALSACNVANGGDGTALNTADFASDAGTSADVGTSADAGTFADAGTSPDAANRPDNGTVLPTDNDAATTPPDVFVAADAKVVADAGPAPDAAVTPPDAGTTTPDSGPAPTACGNLTCEAGETAGNCPVDCGALNQCVLNHCQVQATACMNSSNCRQAFACVEACATDATCTQACLAGKSAKTTSALSALTTCSASNCTTTAPPGPVCGNGVCESGETTANCAQDCPAPTAFCGDGVCNGGETTANCAQDCPAPAAFCGDGVCNGGETNATCAQDCPAPAAFCGDGVCNGGETNATCAQDCPAPAKTCTTYTDVQPIFLANCNGCHGHSFGSSCSAAANYPLIASYVASGAMPQNGTLSSADKAKIAAWATAQNACTTASCP